MLFDSHMAHGPRTVTDGLVQRHLLISSNTGGAWKSYTGPDDLGGYTIGERAPSLDRQDSILK
jgi:hypothetical protein